MKNKALAVPYLVWMAIFTIIPLGIVFYYAFTDSTTGAFTFGNIANIGNYLPIFVKSIWLALVSSIICMVIGYPVAYYIAGRSHKAQRFLYMLIMLPMCISFLLRTMAWVALLDDTGILNGFITALGLRPLPLIRTNAAVVLGMVYNYLPYMIMPLYTVIMKIDSRFIEAAQDLGCNNSQVFRRVVFPYRSPASFPALPWYSCPPFRPSTFRRSSARPARPSSATSSKASSRPRIIPISARPFPSSS